MTSLSSMHETGHSKPVHWDNPKGWDGEGGGREVGEGGGREVWDGADTGTPVADSCQCMAKTTIIL